MGKLSKGGGGIGQDFPSGGDPLAFVAAGAYPLANGAHMIRARGAGLISKIAIHVGVQSGNVSVGIYSKTGSGRSTLPLTRRATSGTVACPAPGYAEIALDVPVYVTSDDYFAISCDNTTATFFRATAIGFSNLVAGVGVQYATHHPLPATATTPITTAIGAAPAMVGVA